MYLSDTLKVDTRNGLGTMRCKNFSNENQETTTGNAQILSAVSATFPELDKVSESKQKLSTLLIHVLFLEAFPD